MSITAEGALLAETLSESRVMFSSVSSVRSDAISSLRSIIISVKSYFFDSL